MLEAVSKSGDHFTKKADETVTWTAHDSAPVTFHLNAEKTAADSAKMVASGTIPALHISGAETAKPATPAEASNTPKPSESHSQGMLGSFESGAMNFFSGAGKVTKDLAAGAWNEVTQHPLQVAEKFGEGAAIGLVATAALVGAAAIAPEALLAVGVGEAAIGIGGLAIGAWKASTHAAGLAHDAHVVSNENNYSKEQVATAHGDLRHVGAETALVTAGVAGALAVPFAAGALESVAGGADRAMFASDTSGFQSGGSGEDTVTGILGRAVQSGQYEVRDVKGVSVLFPRAPQPTVSDVLSNAITSGQYEVQNINGVSVMMPKHS